MEHEGEGGRVALISHELLNNCVFCCLFTAANLEGN